jgi:gamma-glutamylcysteine synthetase
MMQEYQKRVLTEEQELREKCQKLALFLLSCGFSNMNEIDQELLKSQYKAMIQYLQILVKRIERFPKDEGEE